MPRARRRSAREPREPREPRDGPAAMEIAARFLGTRPRTRWEVERRLRRTGVDESIISATIERLSELGYLDDAAFVRWWAEQRDRHAPRGRRMIEAELRQRGVGGEVLEAMRDELLAPDRTSDDDLLPGSEAERARDALARHLRGRALPEDRKAVQRIGMYLMRRGFDAETARAAIRAASSSPGADVTDEPS